MDPAVRYVLASAGALIGAWLGASSGALAAAVAGAVLGFLAGELRVLRARLKRVEAELGSLRRPAVERRAPDTPVAPAVTPPREVAQAPLLSPLLVAETLPAAVRTGAAAPLAARAPRRATTPSPLLGVLKRYFTGGNTLVRIGVIVLFFGVAFLLRYVAEHSHLPIELRLSGVALGAIGLLALGWRLRGRRAGYAFALQGGAVGILYLTVFAALRLYALLPPTLAFAVLVLIAALSAALAVLQDSQAFALLGAAGGFLAPVLASSGEGSPVVLFSYYLVLNAGIVAIAWFRAWRPLNLLGFVFTFLIASAWGGLHYQPADFATTEPFLVVFFLFYVGIAVLFAHRPEGRAHGYVDGTLLYGTPMAAFGLQTAMLHDDPLLLAYSALGVSALYLSVAAWLKARRDPAQSVLLESCLALGVVFLTLAIPLALGNRLNAAAWALEGAGLVWIGCRQSRRLARALGLLLITAAAWLVLGELRLAGNFWLLPGASYAGVVLVTGAGLVASWSLLRIRAELKPWEGAHAAWLFLVGLGCWCIGTLGELPHAVASVALPAAALACLALTAAVLGELAARTCLVYARGAALWLLPVMLLFAGIDALNLPHWAAAGGWAAWPLAFAVLYRLLWLHGPALEATLRGLQHAAAWLLGLALLSEEADWAVRRLLGLHGDWQQAALLLPAGLGLLLLPRLVITVRWPFIANRDAYIGRAGLLLGALLCLYLAGMNLVYGGSPEPLPYLPLLNPFDLAQILAGIGLYRLLRHLQDNDPRDGTSLPHGAVAGVLAAVAFVACNGVLLRTLHHGLGMPMRLETLLASNVVETALSICWSVLALLTMLVASRRRHRVSWIVGATLLGAVILKLFFVDLSSVGSIERIISFLGVGLLMLIIGYFSPLPPRSGETT